MPIASPFLDPPALRHDQKRDHDQDGPLQQEEASKKLIRFAIDFLPLLPEQSFRAIASGIFHR